MGAHAYVVTNALAGLAPTAFTWSGGATPDRDKLNDGRMDGRYGAGTLSSGMNVVVDLGSAKALIGWATLNCNFAGFEAANTPKLLIEAADDSAITVNVVTAKALTTLYTATVPRNKDHVLQFPAVNKRYWRLTWSWTGGGTAPFFIGELFAYTAITQLSRRTIYGSGETKDYVTAPLEMMYGEVRSTFLAGPIRQLNQNWADLTESQRDELDGMFQASNAGALPLLWVDSFESSSAAAAVAEQQCVYGRITKPQFAFKQNDFSIYEPDGFSIRSMGREAGA